MLLEEPTADLRGWFDGWFKSSQNDILNWFSSEDVRALIRMRDHVFVDDSFELQFDDEESLRMARILEFGSQRTPKFDFISKANEFVHRLFQSSPEYQQMMEMYLLSKVM